MSRKKIFLIVCCGAILPLVLILLPVTGVVKLFNMPTGYMSPTVQTGGLTPPSYPLMVSAGSVLALGDNYGNSPNGRYWEPIPVTSVTHSALRIVQPSERAGKIE